MANATAVAANQPAVWQSIGRGVLLVHLVVSPVFFSVQLSDPFEFGKVLLLTATVFIVSGVWISECLATRHQRRCVPRSAFAMTNWLRNDPLAVAVALMLFSAIASTVFSVSPRVSWQGWHGSENGFRTILSYCVLFFATRHFFASRTDARLLLCAVVPSAAVLSLYALIQLVGADPLIWTGLSQFGRYTRPIATLGHPNHLAAYLVMCIPMVGLSLWEFGAQRRWAGFLALCLVLALCGLSIVATISRGAWVATAVVFGVLAVGATCLGGRRGLVVWCALVVMIVAVAGSAFAVCNLTGNNMIENAIARLQQIGGGAGRRHIWIAAFEIFRNHPIVGSGLDTFGLEFSRHRTIEFWRLEWNAVPLRAHNEVMQMLATQGLVGAGALFALVLAGCIMLVRNWRANIGSDRRLVLFTGAGIIAFTSLNCFSFCVASVGSLFVTLLALLSHGCVRHAEEQPAHFKGRNEWFSWSLLVAVAMIALVFVANVVIGSPCNILIRSRAVLLVGGACGALAFAVAWPELSGHRQGNASRLERPTVMRDSSWSVLSLHLAVWSFIVSGGWFALGADALANVAYRRGEVLLAYDPEQAAEHFREAIAWCDTNPFYWARLGSAHYSHSQHAATRDDRIAALHASHYAFSHAIEILPCNAYYHVSIARIGNTLAREKQQDPGLAFKTYDRALDLDSTNPYYFVDAANAALLVNDYPRSKSYVDRGLAVSADFGPLIAHRGYLALAQESYGEAIDILQNALTAQWHGDEAARQFCAGMLEKAKNHAVALHR